MDLLVIFTFGIFAELQLILLKFNHYVAEMRLIFHTKPYINVFIGSVRAKFKAFAQPAVYRPSLSDVKGEKSFGDYSKHELEQMRVQELRDCGLNEEEITLWISCNSKDVCLFNSHLALVPKFQTVKVAFYMCSL